MNLIDVIEELVVERGLDRNLLSDIVCEGMLTAYQRKYPDLELSATFDQDEHKVVVFVEKEVVAKAEDLDAQISLKKAHAINKKLVLGDTVKVPFDEPIGRLDIIRARQVIAGQIRKIEASVVYNEFKEKEGTIVHGTVHKCERGGTVVKVEDHLAFLPKSLTSPADKCVIGAPIRALLKEVLLEPRGDNQLVLDRVSEDFLLRLIELEFPEVFEKLVEVKKIVRSPGYKSKIAVISNDPNIDPVGTCIGVGGSRIKPILKELGNEKVDIIPWSESQELLIKNSLKPAQIDRVEILDTGAAKVWLDEDQRALAIGRMGQNISLASRLTGLDIQLVQNEKSTEGLDSFDSEAVEGDFE